MKKSKTNKKSKAKVTVGHVCLRCSAERDVFVKLDKTIILKENKCIVCKKILFGDSSIEAVEILKEINGKN